MSIPTSNLYDGSCTLFPGEHPFVVKHSFVSYAHCAIADAAGLEEKVRLGQFVAKPMLDAKRFVDVIVGFNESARVAPKFRHFMARVNPSQSSA